MPSNTDTPVSPEATWSPDGKWIAYTARTPLGNEPGYCEELWIVSSDGKINACVGRRRSPFTDEERIAIHYYDTAWKYLAWKPDSTGVAFARGNAIRFMPLPGEAAAAGTKPATD